MLSLLHPLDRYRTPSVIGSAIQRPLSRPTPHPCSGRSSQPPCSKPPRRCHTIVSKPLLNQMRHKKRDSGRDSQPLPQQRLDSQPQGGTKPWWVTLLAVFGGPPDQYSNTCWLELLCNNYKLHYKEHRSRELSCGSYALQGKHPESEVKRFGPIASNPAATADDDDDLHRSPLN